uniref:Uncharacterized protein n=1 Tax=Stomoxys calcitrans TaxID=35570 RepID=A0A1I8NS08_STOCA
MGITWKDLRSVGTKLVLDLQEESLKEKNPKILVKRRKQSTRELHWETEKINNKKQTATKDNCNNHQKVSKKCSKCHKENRCNKYRPRAEKSSSRIDKGTLKLTKNENSSDVHMTPQHIHHIEQAFNHAIKTLKHRKKYLKTKMQREQAVRQQQITADQTSSTTWAENLALRNHFSGGNHQKTPQQRSSTTWAESFARHRDIFKHNAKANSNEHYSSKYKCIRISPRHGNDKDLAIRSQERSVGTQMSDRGALGDQKSQTEKGAGALGYLLATHNPNSTSYHCAPRGHASCHRVHRPENSSCCHQRAEYCFGNCDRLPQFLSHSNQCYDTGFRCHEFTQRSSCLINNGEIDCERSPIKSSTKSLSPVVKEDNTLFQQKESADERNFSKEMENQSASKKEYQNVCKSVNERAKERDKQEETRNQCETVFQRNVEGRKENSQTRNRTHLRPISEGDIKEHRAKNEKRTQEMNEERGNKPELSEESEYRRKLKLMQVLDIERATKFQQVFELYAEDFDTRVQKLEETSSTKLVPSPTDIYKVQSKRKTLQKREPINYKSMETSTKQRLDSKAAEYPLETLRLLKTMKILEYKPIKPKSKEIKGNLDLEYQKALGKQQKYQEYVKSYETDNNPRQVNGSSDNSNSQCASAKELQRPDEGLKRYGTFTRIHAIDAQKTYEEFEKDVIQGSAHIQKPLHHETDHSSLKESDANVKMYPNGLASFGSNSTRTTNEAMNSTIERIRNEYSAAASIVLENGEVVTYDRITSKYIESEKLPIQQNKESLRNHKSPIIESESMEMRSSPAKPNGVENSTQDKFKIPTADIIRKYLTHTEIENQDHKKTQSEGYHKESFRKNFDDSPVKLFTSQTLDSVKASSPSHKTYIAQAKRDELKTLFCRKESPSSFEPLTIETPISGQETSHSLTENTTISDLEQHKIIKDQRNQVIGSLKANYENKMTKDLNSSYVSPSKRYPPSLFSKDLTENHQRLTNAANTQKLSSDQAAHKNQGLHVNAT